MGQKGKFREMENPIGLTKEDDDLVPILTRVSADASRPYLLREAWLN
jgi:hypothetical protein